MTAGSQGARERLIEDHLPMVRRVARRFARRRDEAEELTQVGAIGLINAVDRYDPGRGCGFLAYAEPCVAGEIRRHLRDRSRLVRMPRREYERRQALRTAERALGAELNRSPSPAELAGKPGCGVDEIARLRSPQTPVPASDDAVRVGLERHSLECWERTEDRVALEMALAALTATERMLLVRRFFDDLTQQEIATELGVSQVHVSRLIRCALNHLREELDDRVVVHASGRS